MSPPVRPARTHAVAGRRNRAIGVGRRAILAGLGLLLAAAGPAALGAAYADQGHRHARARAVEVDPLAITIDSLSPASLGGKAPIRVTGTVHNSTQDDYTGVNLMAFASSAPILDTTTLAASAAIAPDEYVGDRITTPGTYATIDSLPAGQTTQYSFEVPQSELAISAAGVYWFGVHAVGDTATTPRDEYAEGRARTFVPLVPREPGWRQTPADDGDVVPVAIVLPIRQNVALTPAGRVGGARRWLTSVSDGGRLDALLDAGEVGGDAVTWLIDPGVLAAVARLAAGNPARSLAPDPAVDGQADEPSDDGSGNSAPTGVAGLTGDGGVVPQPDASGQLTASQQQVAAGARAWLERLKQLIQGHDVLVLPYGDLDLSAAAAHDPTAYERATQRSEQAMQALGLTGRPALAPRSGLLSDEALSMAAPDATILLSDTAFTLPPETRDSVVDVLDHRVLVTSSGAAAGGPSPTAPDDPLAVRQRLLSEAAVRRLAGNTSPVVLMLPADWAPPDASALFDAFDEPWLRAEPVGELLLGTEVGAAGEVIDLAYTNADLGAQLPASSFAAATSLAETGEQMENTLALRSLVRQQTLDEGLFTLSEGLRGRSMRASSRALAANEFLHEQLSRITVVTTDVSLSSDSGDLGLDVVNGLDQPVSVRVQARSDDGLKLSDQGLRRIAGHARVRQRLSISTTRPGIHQLQLVVTNEAGEPTGAGTTIQVRAAQVSGLIWLMMGAGALILFTTIAARFRKRVKEGRPLRREAEPVADATDGPTDGATDGPTAGATDGPTDGATDGAAADGVANSTDPNDAVDSSIKPRRR